ncbi:MAG: YqgE/AlgH family protein [Gammaproteobacteria bacterium]|nr:YqgE/AlgH family protein [Gammaproteobacteria bacterium]NNJ73221.1 YqgE/AlgH family protein [Enterobacterales bacterium]
MAISTKQSHEHQLDDDFPSLENHLLIAMPSLKDPFFKQSVTYVIQHNAEGAMGVMINQPMPINEADLLEQLGLNAQEMQQEKTVLNGGPVQIQRGFVLHRPLGNWDASMTITDNVALTTSMDILQQIGNGTGPDDYLMMLGYAGWDAGQLEQEMLENSWLTVPASESLLFETALEERWIQASQLLGIDIHQMSTLFGHS